MMFAKMQLTTEQKAILQAFLKGENLKINAFAGSGKTTTLKVLAELAKGRKILILVFNNAIARELKRKFKGCYVYTTHSFALRYVKPYLNFKSLYPDKVLLKYIRDYFDISYDEAFFLNEILYQFFISDMATFNYRYLINLIKNHEKLKVIYSSMYHKKRIGKNRNIKLFTSNLEFNFNIVKDYLNQTWLNIQNGRFPVTHSFYVKFFQLNLDKFLSNMHFDVVMLDEGQDTNMVTYDIFKKLPGQKIIVGDTHQGIYGRRGAVNILEKIKDFKTMYLSYSFRVNQDIASKANHILKNYKNEKQTFKAFFAGGALGNGKECIITRTNTSIVKYVADLPEGESIGFERPIEDIFRIPLFVEKIYQYYTSGNEKLLKTIDPYLKDLALIHPTWKDFVSYVCEEINDFELCSACGLVEKVNVYQVYNKAIAFDKQLNKFIATAHSIKGKEYEKVVIYNDFRDLFLDLCKLMKERNLKVDDIYNLLYNHPEHPLIRKYVEEINLIYVAITRASKYLQIDSEAIDKLLQHTQKDFVDILKKTCNSYKK